MPGIVGLNADLYGFIMDPSLPDVQQHWKETGIHPNLNRSMQHITGGYRTVKIPTANVLTLNSVPVAIIPAPPAGFLLVPYLMVASIVFNSVAYALNAAGVSLKYKADGSGSAPGLALTQGFVQSVSGTNHQVVQASINAYSPIDAADTGAPLVLVASTTDPTLGNSDLWVRVYFQIVGVPLSGTQAP